MGYNYSLDPLGLVDRQPFNGDTILRPETLGCSVGFQGQDPRHPADLPGRRAWLALRNGAGFRNLHWDRCKTAVSYAILDYPFLRAGRDWLPSFTTRGRWYLPQFPGCHTWLPDLVLSVSLNPRRMSRIDFTRPEFLPGGTLLLEILQARFVFEEGSLDIHARPYVLLG